MVVRGVAVLFWALAIGLVLSGCSTMSSQPVVWQHQAADFSKYQAFEIWPVFNATELPTEPTVLDRLTQLLKDEFVARRLDLVDLSNPVSSVLAVHSDLVEYVQHEHVNRSDSFMADWTPGRGLARCTLRVRLVDKATSQVVAEITTVKEANTGNLYSGDGSQYQAREWILRKSAEAIAETTARLMSDDAVQD